LSFQYLLFFFIHDTLILTQFSFDISNISE